MQNLYLTLKVW